MNNYGGVDASALVGIYIAYFAFIIILYVWSALALSKVFTKLGEQGFKAWVPILNNVTFLQLGGQNPIFVLFLFLPFVSIVGLIFMIIAANNINKRFGFGTGMTVLAVLASPVWASILGFGSAVPIGGVPRAAAPASFAPQAAAPAAPATPAAWSAGLPPAPPAPAAPSAPAAAVPPPPPPPVAPVAPVAVVPAAPITEAPAAAIEPITETPAPPIVEAPVTAAAPAAPGNPWAPPITGVPGLDISTPAAPVVVPPVSEPIAAPVVNSVDTSAQVAELQPTVEDEEPDFDKTVVAPRKKKETWTIVPEGGSPISLTKSAVLLGRNPSSTAPDTQLVSVPDPSKTVSKTHARLTVTDGVWTIVDLNSTNGVYLLSEDGDETEVDAGVPTVVGDSFRLGDLTVRISKGN